MTAKEYLMQYRTLDARIDAKLAQVGRLRRLAQTAGSQGNSSGIHSTQPRDRIGELTAKIVDLETEINDEIDALVDLEREIRGCISKLTNENQRVVLEMKYINGLTFEKIAENMHYSLRAVYNYHASALKSVQCFAVKDVL